MIWRVSKSDAAALNLQHTLEDLKSWRSSHVHSMACNCPPSIVFLEGIAPVAASCFSCFEVMVLEVLCLSSEGLKDLPLFTGCRTVSNYGREKPAVSLDEVTDITAGIPCATKPHKFTLFCASIYRHAKVSKL